MPRKTKAQVETERRQKERYDYITNRVYSALRDNVIAKPEQYDSSRHTAEIDEATDALNQSERDYAVGRIDESVVKERYNSFVVLHLVGAQ